MLDGAEKMRDSNCDKESHCWFVPMRHVKLVLFVSSLFPASSLSSLQCSLLKPAGMAISCSVRSDGSHAYT